MTTLVLYWLATGLIVAACGLIQHVRSGNDLTLCHVGVGLLVTAAGLVSALSGIIYVCPWLRDRVIWRAKQESDPS